LSWCWQQIPRAAGPLHTHTPTASAEKCLSPKEMTPIVVLTRNISMAPLATTKAMAAPFIVLAACLLLAFQQIATVSAESSCCNPKTCDPCDCGAKLTCPLRALRANWTSNPVLEDEDILATLGCLDPKYSPLVIQQAGAAWSIKGLSNKHKAFISLANDFMTSLYETTPLHIGIARKYGASEKEIAQLVSFIAPFIGFPKIYAAFPVLASLKCSKIVPESGCTECGGYPEEYIAEGEKITDRPLTNYITMRLMEQYMKVYSSIAVEGFEQVWKEPLLSIKSKYFALLLVESYNQAMPTWLLKFHTTLLLKKNIIKIEDLHNFLSFAGMYGGYRRINAIYSRILKDDANSEPIFFDRKTLFSSVEVSYFDQNYIQDDEDML
jgi:alkylhydroperoxidase/carboxymuconolactone decarboxylase family protein YurZ